MDYESAQNELARQRKAAQRIENAQKITQPQDKTVESQFRETKSLNARAHTKKTREKEQGASQKTYGKQKVAERALGGRRRLAGHTKPFLKKAKTARKRVLPFTRFASWMGFAVVCTLYLWQLTFAVVSLAGFGLHYALESFPLVSLASLFPAEYIGLGFWGLAALLSIGTFIVYSLWYKLLGLNPYKTPSSFLVTVTCLGLNIFPITNLFPWLVIWIVYINVSALFLRS